VACLPPPRRAFRPGGRGAEAADLRARGTPTRGPSRTSAFSATPARDVAKVRSCGRRSEPASTGTASPSFGYKISRATNPPAHRSSSALRIPAPRAGRSDAPAPGPPCQPLTPPASPPQATSAGAPRSCLSTSVPPAGLPRIGGPDPSLRTQPFLFRPPVQKWRSWRRTARPVSPTRRMAISRRGVAESCRTSVWRRARRKAAHGSDEM
jgi:hypothetical protein